jgi:hypothetical protein
VRAAAATARVRGEKLLSPFRVATGASRTLVLTARPGPYTVQDLAGAAADTLVREPGGAYLLKENLLLQPGADLNLGAPGGLTLHLASTPTGFVSIVNDGGKLEITGTADAPVRLSSWDPATGTTDKNTSDGRAYVRSIGGATTIAHASIDSLGFWSGRTGGIALTGTDRAAAAPTPPARAPKTVAPTKTPQPAPPLPATVPLLDDGPGAVPDNYATGSITDTTITGNAFGIFTTKARDLEIRSVAVRDSLVDGIVLHRHVSNARVTDSTASHNAGNGFVLARATAGITLTGAVADSNGGSGIYINGVPLAGGPSAGGDPGTISADHTVTGSRASANGRYGIEVIGGQNIGLHANTITGNDRGIGLSRAAARVTIDGNRLEGQKTASVSITDGGPGTVVAGNTITGGTTGIFLLNSRGAITQNTVTGVTLHGITVNGNSPVRLHGNAISGTGPSALNLRDSHSTVLRTENNTRDWTKTKPFWAQVATFFQPLTIIWTLLALILILTAFRGRHHGHRRIVHPYAAQAPLSAFTGDPPHDPEPPAEAVAVVPADRAGLRR